MKKVIFIVFLLCVPSVLADVISPIIDGRATIWGQREGYSVMRIQGEGTSYNCNVTIYDSGLVQRYFAFMQMPQSNNWSFNDLDFGVSSPCSNFTGPCTSSGGGYITWTSPDIPFYNAYRPRYDVENMTYAVSCVRLSWPYTLTEENFTFPLYNYYRVRVDPVNVTWGDDYNLSFSVAQFIRDGGLGPLGIVYNFTLYLYGGAVSIYNYSKIIGIDYQSSSLMEWTNSSQTRPLQVSFGLNSSEVDWNDLPNEDYYYTVKASLVSLMQDAVAEGDYTYASDHLVMSNDTSWIVLSQEVCGNGIIEGAEVCDGFNVSGLTCADYNYTSGSLVCNDLCSDYNVSVCYTCGNAFVEGPEVCDGINLSSQTCVSRGFSLGGILGCDVSCLLFNTSSCLAGGGSSELDFPTSIYDDEEVPVFVIAPVDEEVLQMDFAAFFERLKIVWEAFIATPLQALVLVGGVAVDFTFETIILVVILAALIFLAVSRNKKKNGKKRRR